VVVSIGHGVPEVISAMQEQASKIAFAGGFTNRPQEELAAAIADHSPEGLSYVRFCSGGSEAVETAIKLARHYFVERGRSSKWKVIGRWKSFHGNTIGALAATGHSWRRAEYTPMLAGFPHIPPAYALSDADALEEAILAEGPDDIAAFIAEPVVGAADFARIAPPGYYERIREICDKYDILFIADEVITGFGRTGRFFAIEHWDAIPDIIAFAKGASSGYVPLGGVVVHDRIVDAVERGSGAFEHGHTYNGNPLACATGLAVLRYLDDRDLVAAAARSGDYLRAELHRALDHSPIVGEITGLGLLNGIEIVQNTSSRTPFPTEARISARIGEATRARGVLINPGFGSRSVPTDADRIGVCPPLVITRPQIDEIVSALSAGIADVAAEVVQ
jgi:adenosylmethionine-8-amino-7-oxononanoate aminotransferase